MWATSVDNSGIVRSVAVSGTGVTAQLLGSRLIAVPKANTERVQPG
jgi:hypothetical protein